MRTVSQTYTRTHTLALTPLRSPQYVTHKVPLVRRRELEHERSAPRRLLDLAERRIRRKDDQVLGSRELRVSQRAARRERGGGMRGGVGGNPHLFWLGGTLTRTHTRPPLKTLTSSTSSVVRFFHRHSMKPSSLDVSVRSPFAGFTSTQFVPSRRSARPALSEMAGMVGEGGGGKAKDRSLCMFVHPNPADIGSLLNSE